VVRDALVLFGAIAFWPKFDSSPRYSAIFSSHRASGLVQLQLGRPTELANPATSRGLTIMRLLGARTLGSSLDRLLGCEISSLPGFR
jgi:hypothetical protein